MNRDEAWDALQRGDHIGTKTGLSYEGSYYFKDERGDGRVFIGPSGAISSIIITQFNAKGEPYHSISTPTSTLKKFNIKEYR